MIAPTSGMDPEYIRSVLCEGGVIARKLALFEHRAEQVEMACAVAAGFGGGGHLAVEAGTGVGKSFAYLVPAIDAARRGLGKVLISTYTITLQEQLINKDIPFLAESMGGEFSAVLAKGRGNYLCRRRLSYALRRQKGLFDERADQLEQIRDWAGETEDGSLSDLSFIPRKTVWDAVKSEHGNCRGRKCPHYGDCFYWRARRFLEGADIIVANHALMFNDLVLKEQSVSLLPDYNYVVVDEAHNLEHVAENQFGIDISNYRVRFTLDGLYNPRSRKGLLAYRRSDPPAVRAIEMIAEISEQARRFFADVVQWYRYNRAATKGRCHRDFVEDTISGHLKRLRSHLSKMAKECEDSDEKYELLRYVDRCASLHEDLASFMKQERDDYVYWVEGAESAGAASAVWGGMSRAVYLKSAPINVGPDIKRSLFDMYESVVLTSATLSSGPAEAHIDKRGFEFFASRIGLGDYESLKLGSPYDYANQVTIYIEKDLPNPNAPDFIQTAAEAVKKYLRRTGGRAFVLFTSYRMLDDMAEELEDWFFEQDIELLRQGGGMHRTALLDRFKGGGRYCLFGTDSFWQGVDVPGVALSNVIIMRLPFAVPDRPLLAGRLDQIRQGGGNPFFDYQLPSAIIKFKQGFGRLIRSKTDSGIVVVLDSRIIHKRYGQQFLTAIPQCRLKTVSLGESITDDEPGKPQSGS